MEHEYCSSITIPINAANTEENNEERYFFVILKSSCEPTKVGDPSIAKVSIINDDGTYRYL